MPVKPIANKLVDKVILELDGRKWQLVIDFNMLCDLKQMTGINALSTDPQTNIFMHPDPIAVRTLLYLALREQGADYTLEQTGKLINARTLPPIWEAIVTAWAASMPKKEDQQEGEARAAISA